jgi:hypothetical protein
MASDSKKSRARTSIDTEFLAGAVAGRGKIQNVGESGMFVKTSRIPPKGEGISLRFNNHEGLPLTLSGMVWWTTTLRHPNPGFGVRLLDSNPRYQSLLQRLLNR